jgi:flavodoxin
MKFTYVFFIVFLLGITSCSAQDKTQNEMIDSSDKGKILIVYLTRTGNTEAVAKMVQANIGGDLVSLELENPYPKDYKTIVEQVEKENETGFLPPLKTKIENIKQYDTIFLGFPTWGMQLPPPVKSFLNEYNLSGKTVVPFNTNAGYGVGSSFGQVKQLCLKCTVLEGFEIKGGIERDGILFVMEGAKEVEAQAKIKDWLQKIGMINKSRSASN